MKSLIIFLCIALLLCCNKDNSITVDPNPKGCLTGIIKSCSSNCTRYLIRCCTKAEYAAGNNVAQGGTANLDLFRDWQWVEVKKDCSECK